MTREVSSTKSGHKKVVGFHRHSVKLEERFRRVLTVGEETKSLDLCGFCSDSKVKVKTGAMFVPSIECPYQRSGWVYGHDLLNPEARTACHRNRDTGAHVIILPNVI